MKMKDESCLHNRDFIPRIEAMRGLAALTVAGFHVGAYYARNAPSAGWFDAMAVKFLIAVSNGYGAVIAFFVLSGFVLARSLDRNADPARFFYQRLFRLFPPVVTTIGLFTALFYGFGLRVYGGASYEPLNVVLNMIIVHTDIDRVMWSMKIECVATPLILASVWLYKRSGPKPLCLTGAVLFGLSFVGQYANALGDGSNLAPLYAFVLGILVHFEGNRIVSRIGPHLAAPAAVLSILVFWLCGLVGQSGWILLVEAISAAALIAILVGRPDIGLFRPLDLSIVRFYGRISYSFYLLHPLTFLIYPVTVATILQMWPGLSAFAVGTILTILSIIAITPLAYLSWRWIEIPAIAAGKTAAAPTILAKSRRRPAPFTMTV